MQRDDVWGAHEGGQRGTTAVLLCRYRFSWQNRPPQKVPCGRDNETLAGIIQISVYVARPILVGTLDLDSRLKVRLYPIAGPLLPTGLAAMSEAMPPPAKRTTPNCTIRCRGAPVTGEHVVILEHEHRRRNVIGDVCLGCRSGDRCGVGDLSGRHTDDCGDQKSDALRGVQDRVVESHIYLGRLLGSDTGQRRRRLRHATCRQLDRWRELGGACPRHVRQRHGVGRRLARCGLLRRVANARPAWAERSQHQGRKGKLVGNVPYVARAAFRHFEDPPTYQDHHVGFG